MTRAGVYLSLPFCPSHCAYCSNPAARFSAEKGEAYLLRLLRELETAAPDWAAHTVDTVYIGGGTPTLFAPEQIGRLLEGVARHLNLAADAEITSEANPESVTPTSTAGLIAAGVNRISIGAQSFQERHLLALGRIHTPERVATAVQIARDAGFSNLSLDLIFSLPDQRPEEWADDLSRLIDLRPDHVSAYGLAIENGTPLWVQVQTGKVRVPDAEGYDALYSAAVERLAAAGYRRYEVSNFARPGFECRHNLGYWRGGDYLGLGAGAASHRDGYRYGQMDDVNAYLKQPPGFQPSTHAERLTPRQRAHERAIFGLRTAEGIDLNDIQAATGIDLAAIAAVELERLVASGLITGDGERFRPTPRGFLFGDSVGAALAHLPDE